MSESLTEETSVASGREGSPGHSWLPGRSFRPAGSFRTNSLQQEGESTEQPGFLSIY